MSFVPKGLLPAMITPMTKDYKVNIPALRKLIDYMIDGGVHGIFAIGTTGEFYALTNDEYREVLEVTVDQVAGRVPVYAGANAIGTREAIQLADIAGKVGGIDAISVLTPYFVSVTQNEIYDHFKSIADSTDMNVIMYDNAPKTHVTIKPATVARLADVKNIVGMKDSTGDLTNTADIIGRTTRVGKDFHAMMGRDSLIHAALCYGATGAVAAAANIAPALCASIYDKYMAGDIQGSLDAQYDLVPLRIGFTLGSFPTVIKEGLEMLGIEAGPCALPTGPMTDEERAELRKIMEGMKLI